MPITKNVDHTKKLTIFNVSGKVTGDDLMEQLVAFYTKGPTRNLLWDLRYADMWKVNAKHIENLSVYRPANDLYKLRKKTAFVVFEEYAKDLSKWFKELTEIYEVHFKVQIFLSLDKAKKWLN